LNQTDTDANSLTLKIGTDTSTGISVTGVTADTVETLNVVSNGTGTGTNTLRIADVDLTSVKVTGKEALDFGNTGGKLATLDGSAMEGALKTGADPTALTGAPTVEYAEGTSASDLKAITVKGGAGADVLYGDAAAGIKFQTFTITGGAGNDKISGGAYADTLTGDAGDDQLYGRAGDDTLSGGDGNDQDWGGLGKDTMTGGAGADVFGYTTSTDSQGVNTDTITDFVSGTDKLGFLTAMVTGGQIVYLGDVANQGQADSALATGGTKGDGKANAVLVNTSNQLSIDTTDDGIADMTIVLTGVTKMVQADFVVL
jgi:Ca2+-binding RTX toxin-like protein